jgi:hypothetical protein
MTTISDPLPWAFELCPGCGRNVPLATHDLTCWQYDLRTRVAVAWICDDCDLVVGVVGLFTAWDAAISARQRELDDRAGSYFSAASRLQSESITIDRCRNAITEFRRHGPKERRR